MECIISNKLNLKLLRNDFELLPGLQQGGMKCGWDALLGTHHTSEAIRYTSHAR